MRNRGSGRTDEVNVYLGIEQKLTIILSSRRYLKLSVLSDLRVKKLMAML